MPAAESGTAALSSSSLIAQLLPLRLVMLIPTNTSTTFPFITTIHLARTRHTCHSTELAQ
jgi:hypothetical protein